MLLNIGTIFHDVYFKVEGQLIMEMLLLYLFKIVQYQAV